MSTPCNHNPGPPPPPPPPPPGLTVNVIEDQTIEVQVRYNQMLCNYVPRNLHKCPGIHPGYTGGKNTRSGKMCRATCPLEYTVEKILGPETHTFMRVFFKKFLKSVAYQCKIAAYLNVILMIINSDSILINKYLCPTWISRIVLVSRTWSFIILLFHHQFF